MIFIHRRLFDDMQTASYMAPTLTTIRQPAYEMGQRAANDREKVKTGTGHDGLNTDCSGINHQSAGYKR
jgi:hypothetical protein